MLQHNQHRDIEESVLDIGRSLYKLHFQLLLMLESANKMFNVLCTTASENQVCKIFIYYLSHNTALCRKFYRKIL